MLHRHGQLHPIGPPAKKDWQRILKQRNPCLTSPIQKSNLKLTMKNPSTCPVCGAPLAKGSHGGICPSCLLQAAMGADSTAQEAFDEDDAAHSPPGLSEQPGTRIGHYKLVEQIGEGGFGIARRNRTALRVAAGIAALPVAATLNLANSSFDGGRPDKAIRLREEMLALKPLEGQHDPGAQFCLGSCYATGRGVLRDEAEAEARLRRAAAQNHAPAQHCLGICYEHGDGGPKHEVEACKGYLLAAAQGEKAKNNAGLLALGLPSDQTAEGKRRVKNFKPQERTQP
jgi:hypothetical protein